MSPNPAAASCRRTSVGIALLLVLASSSGTARAADDVVALELGGSSLELRHIPAGTFTQGSPPSEPGREADEAQRNVTISRSFWLGKVPVTRGQFSRFVTETRFVTDAEKGQLGGFGWDGKTLVQKKEFTWRNPGFQQKDADPVVLVSFGDATAFVAWASRKTGKRVRLPTEAEWEYAARAGTQAIWAGANKDDEAFTVGWFRASSAGSTHPVGRKRANAFGLLDMAGNVFEWCRDVYAPYPPGDVTDPETTTNTTNERERRVLRGGSWLRDPKRGRSAARHRAQPGARSAESGFRVAMDDDAPIVPAPRVHPANDFAPAAPVGVSSASPPGIVEDASAPASPEHMPASAVPARPEGGGWSLVLAPIAAAGFAVAWVLARRRREGATGAIGLQAPTAAMPSSGAVVRSPPSPPATPSSHASVRAAPVAVLAGDERPSSPPPSVSESPTGSPDTSEPSIAAASATFSEALLVSASVVEAQHSEEDIVDVPLTPIEPQSERSEAPSGGIVAAPVIFIGAPASTSAPEPARDEPAHDAAVDDGWTAEEKPGPPDSAAGAAASTNEDGSEAGNAKRDE